MTQPKTLQPSWLGGVQRKLGRALGLFSLALIALGLSAHAQAIPINANVNGAGNVQIGSITVNDQGGAGGGITGTSTTCRI